jgi:hypothetical protein
MQYLDTQSRYEGETMSDIPATANEDRGLSDNPGPHLDARFRDVAVLKDGKIAKR